jgi:hypothetical protein
MATLWLPQITYNSGSVVTVNFTRPLKHLLVPSTFGEGGSKRVASGAKEGFVIRWDGLVRVVFLFTEAERPAVLTWLRWAMSTGASFTFRFDAGDATTQYTVDLEEPNVGERVETPRDQDPLYYQLTATLRRTDGNEFDVRML